MVVISFKPLQIATIVEFRVRLYCGNRIQWNLDITLGHPVSFYIYVTITGARKIDRYTAMTLLYCGSSNQVPRCYKNDRDVIYVSTSFPGSSPLFKMAGGRICREATSEIVKEKVEDCPLLIPGRLVFGLEFELTGRG